MVNSGRKSLNMNTGLTAQYVKSVWQQKHETWPELTYGITLGACLIKFKGNKNERGISRLYRILVTETAHISRLYRTETAHFIWKLRCERRIRHTLPQKQMINLRLQVQSALEISEQMLNFPMHNARIGAKASKYTDSIGNVRTCHGSQIEKCTNSTDMEWNA
jgi:hypothetical protein